MLMRTMSPTLPRCTNPVIQKLITFHLVVLVVLKDFLAHMIIVAIIPVIMLFCWLSVSEHRATVGYMIHTLIRLCYRWNKLLEEDATHVEEVGSGICDEHWLQFDEAHLEMHAFVLLRVASPVRSADYFLRFRAPIVTTGADDTRCFDFHLASCFQCAVGK